MLKYKKTIYSLLTFVLFFFGQAEALDSSQAEFYHSQDRKTLGGELKESLNQAKESILIFTFSLSDPEIIDTLNQKALAGLDVTVVIDRDHLQEIINYKVSSVEVVTRPEGEGHLHHKILVVDKNEIWIGSANFTSSAYKTQENFMVRFLSPELGALLKQEADVFRGITQRSKQDPLRIPLTTQDVTFCPLPHDGFPPKKIEKSINEESKKQLIKIIDQAENNIKIAMMVWTNNDLANAVIRAHQRGINVEVVVDDPTGNIPKLSNTGIKVVHNKNFSLMHNKLMCVDDTVFINGSANWSQSSFTRNDESFVIIEPMTENQKEVFKSYWNYLKGTINEV